MVTAISRAPIVVGVDGSHAARLALCWALTEAAVRGCAVHAVHAWSLGSARDFVWASRRSLRADSQALLRTAVAAARRQCDSRVEVACHSIEGHPAAVLAAAARDATLLVLGVHNGRRDHVGLGSIGRSCARHLTVPLVIIPTGQRVTAPSTVESRDRAAATRSAIAVSMAPASSSTSGAPS